MREVTAQSFKGPLAVSASIILASTKQWAIMVYNVSAKFFHISVNEIEMTLLQHNFIASLTHCNTVTKNKLHYLLILTSTLGI